MHHCKSVAQPCVGCRDAVLGRGGDQAVQAPYDTRCLYRIHERRTCLDRKEGQDAVPCTHIHDRFVWVSLATHLESESFRGAEWPTGTQLSGLHLAASVLDV